MVLTHLLLLVLFAVLFLLLAFIAQKTDKEYIIKIGIVLIFAALLVAMNLVLILIG